MNASLNRSEGEEGGAISTNSGSVLLIDSTLSGNSADEEGGGIFAFTGSVTLNGSSVIGNVGGDGGGVLTDSGSITVTDSTFSNNTSEDDGGAIDTDSGFVTITNSTIENNTAEFNGGAIRTETGGILLTNSTVSGNTAQGQLEPDFDGSYGGNGGGIYSQYGIVRVNGSSIRDNTAGENGSGGGIFTQSGAVYLNSSDLTSNESGAEDYGGGGIFSVFGNVSISNSTINLNRTGGSGGGIFGGFGAVVLNNSTVSSNYSNVNGGDALGGGGIAVGGGVVLTNSTVDGNLSTFSNGGGILAIQGAVVLNNSTVSNNVADNGGGIFAEDNNSVILLNSTVSSNFSFQDGAGIYGGSSTSVEVLNSTITGNTASGQGGGIGFDQNNGASLTLRNSIVAVNEGGLFPDVMEPFLARQTNLSVANSLIGFEIGFRFNVPGFPPSATVPFFVVGAGPNNVQNVNSVINLGPLADNGGPTLTHALLPGSLAIDRGDNALLQGVVFTDQRSFSRLVSGTVDIGAVEFGGVAPTVNSVVRDEGGVLARPDLIETYAISFDQPVDLNVLDLVITNTTTGTIVDTSSLGYQFNSNTLTGSFQFFEVPLEPGFYSFELPVIDFSEEVYVAIPGDANLDGFVNVLDDAFALVGNIGTTAGAVWADGDFNGDGQVDVLGDAFILIGNLNRDVRPTVASQTLVATQFQPTVSAIGSVVIPSATLLVISDGENDEGDALLTATSSATGTQVPELALAGAHDLRDDVFGSDF